MVPAGLHPSTRRSADARLMVRRLPYTHFGIVSATGWADVAALLDADPARST
ncbi:hypothetical protein AB0N05_36070 [Nocardia sp. NPDC051030]|uniref:hypothetical protein n=1 Tax=Nocardia sp. NPDC051030 TaxID=3155162 RepID=UPI0034275892